jgi:hypothetical protein
MKSFPGPLISLPKSAVTFLLFASTALAGPMVHHIEFVTPRAGQRGTTVDVTLEGAFIREPREILFYHPGIRCVELKSLPSLPAQRGTIHGGFTEDNVMARFQIDADCPPGLHPFKLRTATELTTLSTFAVTRFPIVKETQEDQSVPMNSTVLGRMDTNQVGDVDVYRVIGRKGGHLSVEVDSVWLTEKFYAGSEFDLTARILDANGRELARNDDSALHLQDPVLSTLLPADGEYRVEVKQRVFNSGGNCYYLAHIGSNHRPLAIFPAGGMKGEKLSATLLGGASGAEPLQVALPAQAGDFDFNDTMPSSLLMRVSDFPNVLEGKDADETAVPNLPSALNGRIESAGDSDSFRVKTKAGERWRVRVFARSLGTPLDPKLSIRKAGAESDDLTADDATLIDHDLWAMSRQIQRKELMDPAVIWEPKADGDHLINITDMRGLGDPTSVYRIEVEPVRDEINTFIQARVIDMVECPRLTSIAVPQGGRWTVNVNLIDAPGSRYKGDLDLVAHGLPKGVRMIAPHVLAGQRQVPVQFIAEATTKPQTALISISCKATDGTPLLSRAQQSFPFLGHSGGHAWHSLVVDHYAFAVTEAAPYQLDVGQPAIPLSQNGELSLPVKITRRAGFDEAVEFQFDWVPAGVESEPTVTIPAGQSEGAIRLSAGSSAVPGTYQLALTASTTGGSYYLGAGRIRASSAFIDITVAQPYIALKSNPAAVRRGGQSQIVWEVEHKKPFEGKAETALLGLPKGVTVTGAPKLASGDKQLIFDITASTEALLGQYKELSCEITVTERGQQIRQRTGKGILRVDPALQQAQLK